MTSGLFLQPATNIGVITALRREARLLAGPQLQLARIIRLDTRVCVYVCGMGQRRADHAARALLDAGCEALVSFGTAGGLGRDLSAGALVIPERVLDEDGHAYAVNADWRRRLLQMVAVPELGQCAQLLVSVTQPVSSREEKSRLAQASGACAVDMESAAIARLASENGIPLLVVRAVSDDSRQPLPPALMPALDVYGQIRIPALLKALCLHPAMLGHLPGLARGLSAAERALAAVVTRAGLRFGA